MSNIRYIRNGRGQIIAQERGNLIQKDGKVIARFNKGTNITTNAKSEIIGYGDQRLTELSKKVKK